MLKFCYLFSPDPKPYATPIIWDLLEEKEEEAYLWLEVTGLIYKELIYWQLERSYKILYVCSN